MGSYGNTMGRWYHRAAVILWRREGHHAVMLEIALEVMIRELLQLAQKKMTRPQIQEVIRTLLPNLSGLSKIGLKPSALSPVFKLALKLDDPVLARDLLLPLGLDAPTYMAKENIISKLSQIIKHWAAYLPSEHDEFTHWLQAHQLSQLKQKHLQQAKTNSPRCYRENAPARIAELIDLFSAALVSLDSTIYTELVDHLIANESRYLMFDLVEIAQYLKQQHQQSDEIEQHCARLLKCVKDKPTIALDQPPRQAGDWSIAATDRCGCADCQVLVVFLRTSRQDRKVWALAKGRRQHIHQTIDAMGIPVTHKTERSGSPHKLHLKKTKQLFLQDKAQRLRLKEALDGMN